MFNEEYESLPYIRKYRPSKVSEYEGNEKAIEAVMRNLKGGRRIQTILLWGSAGTGKTTLGRLIGKEYLCENRDDVHGACGVCPNCIEMEKYIQSGKTEDLMIDSFITEVNAALDRGVKTIESIIEEANYMSFGSEWKIWIFDEFQKASESAQTAMLKTLEEPPQNTLWIFCTTDPDKINEALMTRFNLILQIKKPTLEEINKIMINVANREGFKWERKALNLIGVRSDYTPRKALTILERIVNERGDVSYENTLDILQEVAEEVMFEFFKYLLDGDTFGYVRLIHKIKKKFEIKDFVENLITFTNRGIYILNDSDVEGLSERELKSYKKLFSRFTVQDISSLLKKLLDMKSNISAETKLLMLGYTGISTYDLNVEKPTLKPVEIENETSKEKSESLKSVEDKMRVDIKETEKAIDDLSKEASVQDILSMFSGTSIKSDSK